MEYIVLIPIIVIIITIFLIFSKSKSNTKLKLPLGPKPWPIIGNILELGDKPHQTFTELSKTYGPIMFVKLGFVPTIVISSPDIAQEMFLKHDITFSDRNVPDSVRAMDHDKYSMAWLPVSPKWRNLRKIAAVQLFTNNRLDGGKELRQKKAQELGDYVRQCRETSTPVDINKAASTSVSNLLSNTIFSMDLNSHSSTSSQEFNELILHMMEVAVTPNVSDLFPMLKHLDLQGVLKRTNKFTHKIMKIFDKIIKERLLKDPMNLTDDVLGTLLKLLEDKQMSIHDVKHFLMDLFTGGIHTTSVTVEWAMAELLHNPQKMKKAQIEIHEVVGKDKPIQESDITKLPYLQAIVKETLRLHPPAPLLIPRKTIKDVELCNYFVPQNSNILINLWGMARDSTIWSNPCLFSPERFLDSEIDFKGRYFEFIPFGSGRRICPGLPLAHRMIHLLLATLISFNWKISPDTIDMEEKFGISLLKLKPLQVIPYFG